MIADIVRRLIADAQAVADFAAQMDLSDAGDIVTWTDEPALLAEPGQAPQRFHHHAVAAARLLVEQLEA